VAIGIIDVMMPFCRSKKAENKQDSGFRMFTAEKAGVEIPLAASAEEAEVAEVGAPGDVQEHPAAAEVEEPVAMEADA